MENNTDLILTVRPLEKGDTELLYSHFCGLSPQSRAKFRPHDFTRETAERFTGEGLNNPDCIRFICVAETDGDIQAAGYCFLCAWRDDVPSLGIAVSDCFQGHGVGRKMMNYMIEKARSAGKKGLRLTTDKDNFRGQALYKSCGFVITGEGNEDDYKLYLALDGAAL